MQRFVSHKLALHKVLNAYTDDGGACYAGLLVAGIAMKNTADSGGA